MTTYSDMLARPHAVYRFFAKDGTLLYVGCTSFLGRIGHHQATRDWFHEVATITIEWAVDALVGRQVEMHAINVEQPKYNLLIFDPNSVLREPLPSRPRHDGTVCPKCGGPKEHKPGLAYCRPCMRAYQEERRRSKGVKPAPPPTITCPRCGGIKEAGKAYCRECKRQVSKAARRTR